jgi:hypothetical protein
MAASYSPDCTSTAPVAVDDRDLEPGPAAVRVPGRELVTGLVGDPDRQIDLATRAPLHRKRTNLQTGGHAQLACVAARV